MPAKPLRFLFRQTIAGGKVSATFFGCHRLSIAVNRYRELLPIASENRLIVAKAMT
jgi:hypothetical protein